MPSLEDITKLIFSNVKKPWKAKPLPQRLTTAPVQEVSSIPSPFIPRQQTISALTPEQFDKAKAKANQLSSFKFWEPEKQREVIGNTLDLVVGLSSSPNIGKGKDIIGNINLKKFPKKVAQGLKKLQNRIIPPKQTPFSFKQMGDLAEEYAITPDKNNFFKMLSRGRSGKLASQTVLEMNKLSNLVLEVSKRVKQHAKVAKVLLAAKQQATIVSGGSREIGRALVSHKANRAQKNTMDAINDVKGKIRDKAILKQLDELARI